MSQLNISGVMNVVKGIFFLLSNRVLQLKKFIVVSFLISESHFGCKRQSYTVYLSSLKSVLQVNINMLSLVKDFCHPNKSFVTSDKLIQLIKMRFKSNLKLRAF